MKRVQGDHVLHYMYYILFALNWEYVQPCCLSAAVPILPDLQLPNTAGSGITNSK